MSDEVKPSRHLATTGLGAGILASSVLAAITLAVFYVLQDYGPESALRKYNETVLNLIQDTSDSVTPQEERQANIARDVQAYDQISAQPLNDKFSSWLVTIVRDRLANGGRLRLVAMVDRKPTFAVANAAFVFPDNTLAPVMFEITKQDHIWKVDPEQTWFLRQRTGQPSAQRLQQ